MKDTLIFLIKNDTTYNKSVTRYLYKTHPELWSQILEFTQFLPIDAKPKQRIWHVINNVTVRPVCPITGEFVKWWENRYLGSSGLSAKTQLSHLNGKYKSIYSEEINEKRRQSNKKRVETGRKYRGPASEKEKQKRIETNLLRYGVKSTLQLKEVREKQYQTKCKNGRITPREKRSSRQLYYDAVVRFTKENWKLNFDKINPSRLNRSEYDLDHIYSIQQGFRDQIPPYIIGHWTNLQMLLPYENYSKGMQCGKSKEQLFEDFFSNYK